MSKSQMKRINLQKGLPMDTPNHSEVARNIVDKFGIGYINGEKANCLELNITNALVQSFLDGRKSGINASVDVANELARKMNILGSDAKMVRKMTHAEIQAERVYQTQDVAQAIKNLMREGK